ncbi:3-deoxy-manno-octulosonate cytidylyltransferase [Robiginitomaculum antarcticum]|uniref:3-deoxy-manno-octulosonate cytidylyltransferase n=1 Tax=Robiginitomaculum antarcticum TaxID=437507 RepID=UPI000370A3AF|nr:3-deoxy-manno-octulosonate cytidylyltransferase [Robiginitomaculum antarcticum]
MNSVIIIPARMASLRLPGKPLADICGAPMIVRCAQRAQAAALGPVYIACCEPEVRDAVQAAGYEAVMTDPDLPSGTDRIKAALEQIDPDGKFDTIINVQGDLPTLDPSILKTAMSVMDNKSVDIGTLAVETEDPGDIANPNVVKAVISFAHEGAGRALYFTRASAPSGDGPVYHHVGLYVYRRAALNSFCALAPSPLERRERLEQLRALEAGMRIDVALIDTAPHGVDTPADLVRARAEYESAL